MNDWRDLQRHWGSFQVVWLFPLPYQPSAAKTLFVSFCFGQNRVFEDKQRFNWSIWQRWRCSLLRLSLDTILTLRDRYRNLPAHMDAVFTVYLLTFLPGPKPDMTISWHIWGLMTESQVQSAVWFTLFNSMCCLPIRDLLLF